MTWVRVDDHVDQHPKIAQVGPLGLALWVAGLAYCNRNLTDGYIPWGIARTLIAWQFLGPDEDADRGRKVYRLAICSGMVGDDVDADFVIALLLDAGLWIEDGTGYRIHDFLHYQPSREQVESERRRGAARQARFRNARSNAVTNGGVTPAPVPVPVVDDSSPSSSGPSGDARARGEIGDAPAKRERQGKKSRNEGNPNNGRIRADRESSPAASAKDSNADRLAAFDQFA